jgi:hypothetical protein
VRGAIRLLFGEHRAVAFEEGLLDENLRRTDLPG